MILAWPLPTGCLPLFWGFRIIVSRSAALLKLGHPNLALEDIAEAVKACYPQDLTYKVKYFWEKCKVKNVYVWVRFKHPLMNDLNRCNPRCWSAAYAA